MTSTRIDAASSDAASGAPSDGPLCGLRVLDLTLARAGPAAVRVFADWGADVIRIEPPARADGGMGGREGSDHLNLHRNKRAIALDLKQEAGRDVFFRLLETADIVIENMRPGVTDRLGVGYEAARARNPRVIYGSISGYGHEGPMAERPCYDQVAQGFSGIMAVTGPVEGPPMRAGVAITDLFAGALLAQGVLIALHERTRTGVGRHVRTSLVGAGIAALDFQAARWLVDGDAPGREGNHHPTLGPMGLYPTADGHINLSAFDDARFRTLCAVIGAPELAEDARFSSGRARGANRPALNAAIAAVTERRSSAEWLEALDAAGIPCGPVNDIPAVFDHPQVAALGMVVPAPHAERGDIPIVAQPVEIEGHERRIRRAAPAAGADTDAVLDELGLDDVARAALRRDGVI